MLNFMENLQLYRVEGWRIEPGRLDGAANRCDCFPACRRIHQQGDEQLCSLTSFKLPPGNPSPGVWSLAERWSFPASPRPPSRFLPRCCNNVFPQRPIVVVTENLKTQESFQQDLETWLKELRRLAVQR